MPRYEVVVRETLLYTLVIEATDEEAAVTIAEQMVIDDGEGFVCCEDRDGEVTEVLSPDQGEYPDADNETEETTDD